MGMNRSRRDVWEAHEPTRFVFVPRGHRYARPWQGYVVEFRQQGRKWEALVVYMDEDAGGSPLIWKWWPVEKLRSAKVDPNKRRDEWF